MFALDVADKAIGVSLWSGRTPVATALVKRLTTASGNIYVVEDGVGQLHLRDVSKDDRFSRLTVALERCIRDMMENDSVNLALCSSFIMEGGYVGSNKKTSLAIAEHRGAVSEMLQRVFGMIPITQVMPDEWRSTISKTMHPGLVWPKDRDGRKEMMLKVAKIGWPGLKRSASLSPDEADSLGVGWHYVSTGGYFEK